MEENEVIFSGEAKFKASRQAGLRNRVTIDNTLEYLEKMLKDIDEEQAATASGVDVVSADELFNPKPKEESMRISAITPDLKAIAEAKEAVYERAWNEFAEFCGRDSVTETDEVKAFFITLCKEYFFVIPKTQEVPEDLK